MTERRERLAPEDEGAALVARVRRELATCDRAVPTMALATALDVSARLGSRLLFVLEGHPSCDTLAHARRLLPVPSDAQIAETLRSVSTDEAVRALRVGGMSSPRAREAVDAVVLGLAIDAWLLGPPSATLVHSLANLACVDATVVEREGAAATFRRIAGSSLGGPPTLARALVAATGVRFDDAWRVAQALSTTQQRDAVVGAAERIDAGAVDASAALLIQRLGVSEWAAERMSRALADSFGAPSR